MLLIFASSIVRLEKSHQILMKWDSFFLRLFLKKLITKYYAKSWKRFTFHGKIKSLISIRNLPSKKKKAIEMNIKRMKTIKMKGMKMKSLVKIYKINNKIKKLKKKNNKIYRKYWLGNCKWIYQRYLLMKT